MCGIVGLFNPQNKELKSLGVSPKNDVLALAEGMLSLIEHRGPDEMGILTSGQSFFANARLKIIDLLTGTQPIASHSKRYWIVYNGEIYDNSMLRGQLQSAGMEFQTTSDTETIVNLFEKYGTKLTEHLNGEYAFAIFDSLKNESYLFRDPIGIKPLYYRILENNAILFSSEIKPLLWATGSQSPEINSLAVTQSLETWTPIPPQTSFKNILQLKPGSFLKISSTQMVETRHWTFAPQKPHSQPSSAEVRELLSRAVSRRMVADVPVGVYLSGGLDSTVVSLLAARNTTLPLKSFSIEFENLQFDESSSQAIVQKMIGSEHHKVRISQNDILENFVPSVLSAESITFRSAAVPMFLLSQLAQREGVKVVLTGEGSDELFGGYDIYKEAQILSQWSKEPDGPHFSDILKIYSYLPQFQGTSAKLMLPFYKSFLPQMSQPFAGHLTRWSQVTGHLSLLNKDTFPEVNDSLSRDFPELAQLNTLDQTRAVECLTLLHGYLLSSQGDRMASAHSIETRLPFLDRDVLNYAFSHSVTEFMDGLKEKQILYDAFKKDIPDFLFEKRKKPFLSLDAEIFFTEQWPVQDYINSSSLKNSGVFDEQGVLNFLRRIQATIQNNKPLSRRDNTAFFVVLSSLILQEEFKRPLQVKDVSHLIKKVVRL